MSSTDQSGRVQFDVPTTVTAIIEDIGRPNHPSGQATPSSAVQYGTHEKQSASSAVSAKVSSTVPSGSRASNNEDNDKNNSNNLFTPSTHSVGGLTLASATTSAASTPVNPPTAQKKAKGHVKNKASVQIPHIPAANLKPEDKNSTDRIRLGICAMDKKARSKPMAEILSRLDATLFQVIFFGDAMIQNRDIEEWPKCDVLIAFFSKGYPLEKVRKYVEMTKPFILNDLAMQDLLKDRRRVYDLLEASGIDVPRHVYLSKDDYVSTGSGDGNGARDLEVQEFDDHIECNGMIIHKPFVEKPVDADDHNIAIYYPTSAGGGCKKLFRKIGNKSSEFYPDINEVRRDGSYIYEEFVETQGTDVKMYTVGPEYGHAEARKSPTVDGKVQRNSDGKEVRFPVILTLREKEIARRIVLGFKQFVCGFDLLRVQEGHSVVSFVCDVNGFSFVKNSRKYYDDCAQILTEHMLATVKPSYLKGFSTLDPLVNKNCNNYFEASQSFFPIRPSATLSRVARLLQGEPTKHQAHQHEQNEGADKMLNKGSEVCPSPSRSEGGAVTPAATTLVEGAIPVREMPDHLTSEPASICASSSSSQEDPSNRASLPRRFSSSESLENPHREELRCVIAVVRHGDRTPKQKLKVNMNLKKILKYFHDHSDDVTKDLKVKAKAPMTEFLETVKTIIADFQSSEHTGEDGSIDSFGDGASYDKKKKKKLLNQLLHMRDVLVRWKITGLNRKLQIKPKKLVEDEETGLMKCTEVQLILKWGGNLTKLGEKQAISLGQRLRHTLYPDSPGGGILRLHSTFRHDLKIKTSDEGRVMKTAAAFAKGLLELEGEIPPILVSLVHKEKGSMHMLDPSGDKDAKLELDECKEKITANLQRDIDFRGTTEEDRLQMVGPEELTSMRDALARVQNPRKTLLEIHKTMGYLIEQLEELLGMLGSGDEKRIEGGEGLKGNAEDDVALSGVKLYKGETLLELTERWRFIYKRLYDPDEDTFDLSRIPDVHDNVRFDVLHNPHLGLTSTLEKLYELAKSMADCVVPQEYGTTIAEKRSVGVKICSSLLEKIMYDLKVARTDNKADMRYMINMDYSADLPINTMGRRIRTRLYFTSESHLHTMLNVLRFAGIDDGTRGAPLTILSQPGIDIINNTSELCYLTQIIIRLFEDAGRPMDDPRRFRVEIHFSPGANSTPLHMHEAIRDADATRFDTAPLESVGRASLTCTELEDYFGSAITEGRKDKEEEFAEVASASTADNWKKSMNSDQCLPPSRPKHIKVDKSNSTSDPVPEGSQEDDETEVPDTVGEHAIVVEQRPRDRPLSAPVGEADAAQGKHAASSTKTAFRSVLADAQSNAEDEQKREQARKHKHPSETNEGMSPGEDKESSPATALARKYFWSSVALGTLLLGTGCIVMAVSLTEGSTRYRRAWSRR